MTRPTLDPAGFFRRIPLAPHEMRARHTRTAEAIVLCHLGVPRLDREHWSLTIDGLVETALTLTFADLLRFPKIELTSIHQCAGSPLQPLQPTRRICNLTWGGARLADILSVCSPLPRARYVWSYGADFGAFDGVEVETYLKDLPVGRVSSDVLVAYELNGAELPPEHGFPARLVVPGYYGTNSVKWLTRMTLAETRASGPFTTRWYNDPVLDSAGVETGTTKPVWAIAPEAVIVAPTADDIVAIGSTTQIWGWAWSDCGIAGAEVSVDGESWLATELEAPRGREWQRFCLPWQPKRAGRVALRVRATSVDGEHQPLMGARNAVHEITVTVA